MGERLSQELFATEVKIFESKLPELLETDYGRWALIKDTDFVGAFDTENDAISVGYQEYGNEPFFTRQILEEQPILYIDYAQAA